MVNASQIAFQFKHFHASKRKKIVIAQAAASQQKMQSSHNEATAPQCKHK